MLLEAFAATIAAVVIGNAMSFVLFMAIMKTSRDQKEGTKDTELPIWVYAGVVVPAIITASGLYFTV